MQLKKTFELKKIIYKKYSFVENLLYSSRFDLVLIWNGRGCSEYFFCMCFYYMIWWFCRTLYNYKENKAASEEIYLLIFLIWVNLFVYNWDYIVIDKIKIQRCTLWYEDYWSESFLIKS